MLHCLRLAGERRLRCSSVPRKLAHADVVPRHLGVIESKTPFSMDGFGSIVQRRRPIEPVNASHEERCAGMRDEGLHGPTHVLIAACVRHRHVNALANCVAMPMAPQQLPAAVHELPFSRYCMICCQ